MGDPRSENSENSENIEKRSRQIQLDPSSFPRRADAGHGGVFAVGKHYSTIGSEFGSFFEAALAGIRWH